MLALHVDKPNSIVNVIVAISMVHMHLHVLGETQGTVINSKKHK